MRPFLRFQPLSSQAASAGEQIADSERYDCIPDCHASTAALEGPAGQGQSSGGTSSGPGNGTIATRYVSALADPEGLLSPWSLTATIR